MWVPGSVTPADVRVRDRQLPSPTPVRTRLPARHDCWMRVQLDGVRVTVGADRVNCSTELVGEGGFVVTAITVVADVGVQLLSCYVAGLQGPAAVTHMLSASSAPRFKQHTVQLAGATLARACLLDHAAQLRELLEVEYHLDDVRIDIQDRSLAEAQRVWEPNAADAR
jgi:hypothetical protein